MGSFFYRRQHLYLARLRRSLTVSHCRPTAIRRLVAVAASSFILRPSLTKSLPTSRSRNLHHSLLGAYTAAPPTTSTFSTTKTPPQRHRPGPGTKCNYKAMTDSLTQTPGSANSISELKSPTVKIRLYCSAGAIRSSRAAARSWVVHSWAQLQSLPPGRA